MIQSCVTISLVPEARGGPFVFWDPLPVSMEKAAQCGFDAVEIFAPGPDAYDAAQITADLDRHGLCLAALGTGAGWVRHRLHLTHPDKAARIKAREFIQTIIESGSEFAAPAIIGSMQGRFENEVSREQALDWLAEGLTELGADAEDQGSFLLYEPLNRYETNLFNRMGDAVAFIHERGIENVKILCDLFHMNIEETDIAAALRDTGDLLGHVHFVDSNRRAAGYGHLNFEPIADMLKEMEFEGYASAEAFPLPDSEAAAAQTMTTFNRLFR